MPRKKREKRGSAKSFEQRMEDFGEEVGNIGEKFGRRAECFGEDMERGWHSAFGFIGPLISSIFGIILLAIGVWILGFVASKIEFSFLLAIKGFLQDNLGLFFLLMLFFNYAEYFSKVSRRAYKPFSPIIKAAGFVVVVWILANLVLVSGSSIGIPVLPGLANFALRRLFWVFGFFVILGYIILLVARKEEKPRREEGFMARTARTKKTQQAEPVKRLYRSGKDKILGGVCGGLAEHLRVDPVIIRLIWVVAAFIPPFWGGAILLYIIAWIIIPRNPNHKWN